MTNAHWKVSESIFMPNWKVSQSESAIIGKCQNWKVPELESVRIGKCQNWKVSELENVITGKCFFSTEGDWKLSETAEIGKCQKLFRLECVRNCSDWSVSESAQIGK